MADMEAGSPAALVPPPSATPNAPPHPPSPQKPSTSKILSIVNLVSRILTFVFLLIALVIHAINTIALDDGTTGHFSDVVSYRYTVSAIVIGFVYELVQIGFALYRLITAAQPPKWMLIFDFYGDKSISYLFATGAAAGFGAGIDMKRRLGPLGYDDFFDKGNAATSLLFIAFLFSATSSIASSYALPKCNFH